LPSPITPKVRLADFFMSSTHDLYSQLGERRCGVAICQHGL
jgi:hypothetical protein